MHDVNEPETSSDSNFTVEMDESNDSVDSFENQNDLTVSDDEVIPVISTRKKEDWVGVATKSGKSLPKQLVQRNIKRCTVCGHTSSLKNLSRHMRTHTDEKPYRCD